MIIDNTLFYVDSTRNWVAIDDDGDVTCFTKEPTFQYWNGYRGGRYWDTDVNNTEWDYIGNVRNLPYKRLYKIER